MKIQQSIKIQRLTKLILSILNTCLYKKIQDPLLNEIYFSFIYLTNNKSLVKAYIYSNENIDKKLAINKLEKLTALFHDELSDKLDLYKIPKIIFFWDDQIEKQEKIESILNSCNK